jgi:hypothetical protein
MATIIKMPSTGPEKYPRYSWPEQRKRIELAKNGYRISHFNPILSLSADGAYIHSQSLCDLQAKFSPSTVHILVAINSPDLQREKHRI